MDILRHIWQGPVHVSGVFAHLQSSFLAVGPVQKMAPKHPLLAQQAVRTVPATDLNLPT